MARTVNTSAPTYPNLFSLYGVDTDHATVRDFMVSATVCTLDSGGTAPSSGTYGYGLNVTQNGSFSTFGYALSGGAVPTTPSGSGQQCSIFAVFNSLTTNGGAAAALMCESGGQHETTIGFAASGSVEPAVSVNGGNEAQFSSTIGHGPYSICATYIYNGGAAVYVNGGTANGGSQTTAGADGGNGASDIPARIGTFAGSASYVANIVWIAIFNTSLSQAQVAALHNALGPGNTWSGANGLIVPPVVQAFVPHGPGVSPVIQNQFRTRARAFNASAAVLVGSASAQSSGSASSLTTGIPLGSGSSVIASASGSLGTQGSLNAASGAVASANGALTTGIPLAGAALVESFNAAAPTTGINLSASAPSMAALAANLGTFSVYLGSVTSPGPGVGPFNNQQFRTRPFAFSTVVPSGAALQSASAAKASASGALSTDFALAGAALVESFSGGTPTTAIPLSGSLAAISYSTPALTNGVTFSVAAGDIASGSAALTAGISLSGAALAESFMGGTFGGFAPSVVGGNVSLSGQLTTGIVLAPSVAAAVASGAGQVTTGFALSASGTVVVSSSSSLFAPGGIATRAGSIATMSGTLTTGIPLNGSLLDVVSVRAGLAARISIAPIRIVITGDDQRIVLN